MYNYYLPPAPSSTPWAPAWSPNGQWIAVSMAGSIWRVDPDSGNAEELTYNGKYHSSPDWSPDGRWIVYTADDGGKGIQLEMLDVATGRSHSLTEDAQIYLDPVFSPDGSRLAYVSTKPNGYFNVYIRAIKNGQWAGDAIAVTRDNRYHRDRLYFGEWDMHITPEWTRDSKELLLVSNRNVPLGSGHIWILPAAANAIDEAAAVLAEQSLYRARPDVSIDGKRIVYSSTGGAADQYSNLYVLPTRGGAPYKLTFYEHDAFHPRWSPDGDWIAYISNAGGLPQLEILETYGGERRKVRITDRQWKRPMGELSVEIIDESTGESTASRVHLTASDGKFYCPPDSFARLTQGSGDRIFHTTGGFQMSLPIGKASLTVVKGFEYWPVEKEVQIRPGEVTEVKLTLKRMEDMAAKGWYSGSTHMHMNYGGNLHNSLENLIFMSSAEDQDVVNQLVANKDNRILDYQFFVPGGGAHPVSRPDRLVMVGQEYRPPFYGHVTLIGLRDHLISPWATGYEGTGIESLYPSNTDILRKAKDQGAVTGYAHAFAAGTVENMDPINSELGYAKALMVDAALDAADGVEWSFSGRAGFYPWYAILNNGLRVVATGGDDSMSDLHISKLPGSARTYVHTGTSGLLAEAWKRGLDDGRAFVTTGPVMEFEVNGKMPGGEVILPSAGGTVNVAFWVKSITPLTRLTLIFNGEPVDEIKLRDNRNSFRYAKTHKVTRSGWFHVLAEGEWEESFPLDTGFAQAFTNPVWVFVGKQPVRDLKAAEYSIRWINKLESMAEMEPGWRSQGERDYVLKQFDEARRIYQRFAREAKALSQR